MVWSLTEGRRAPISRPAFFASTIRTVRGRRHCALSRARHFPRRQADPTRVESAPPHRVAGPTSPAGARIPRREPSVRARAIAIVFNPWFDRFIMSLIMLNCLFLAMDSKEPGFAETTRGCVRHPPAREFPIQQPHHAVPRERASLTLARDRPSQKPRRQTVEGSENVFLALFVMEMCLKIIALGFWWEQHTYLTDNWNRLDFVVVILGIVAAFDLGNFSAIRTVRVLRPLRTLQGFAGMRQLVVTLLKSLPLLMRRRRSRLLSLFPVWPRRRAALQWSARSTMRGARQPAHRVRVVRDEHDARGVSGVRGVVRPSGRAQMDGAGRLGLVRRSARSPVPREGSVRARGI